MYQIKLKKDQLEEKSIKNSVVHFNFDKDEYVYTDIIKGKCDIHGDFEEKLSYLWFRNFGCRKCYHETSVLNRQQTFLKKYGSKSPFGSKDVRQKIDETNIKKYGNRCSLHGPEIKKQVENTFLKKYGSKQYLGSKDCKNKALEWLQKNYGVDSIHKVDHIEEKRVKKWKESKNETIKKMRISCIRKHINDPVIGKIRSSDISDKDIYSLLIQEKSKQENLQLKSIEIEKNGSLKVLNILPNKDDDRIKDFLIECSECKKTFLWNEFTFALTGTKREPYCTECIHKRYSKEEKEVLNFIKSIYSGTIIENDRKILKGKELDIYMPEINIAIEYNGCYWHGFHKNSFDSLAKIRRDSDYKRVECKKQGIRLINIDDVDWKNNQEVIQRFFQDTICDRIRIFARKCIIKEIDTGIAKSFCEYYHVNGYRGGSFKYGLYYDDDLICVAVFAKYKSDYECIRLCYKTGIDIIGGWAKIQKHFGKRFLHYVNLKYFDGENKTGVGYRLSTFGGNVFHRNALQKKTGLYKHCKVIDPSLSDFKNCINNNMVAIFDNGNDIRWYN